MFQNAKPIHRTHDRHGQSVRTPVKPSHVPTAPVMTYRRLDVTSRPLHALSASRESSRSRARLVSIRIDEPPAAAHARDAHSRIPT